MKKIITLLASLAIVSALTSCSNTAPKKTEEVLDTRCRFPEANQKLAPDWICGRAVYAYKVVASGSAAKTAAGVSFQKEMATTAARSELARILKSQVESMIKQYAETTGAASSETVDQVNSVTTKLITAQSVSGSKMIDSVVSPEGTLYVLVGMDTQAVQAQTKDVITTSMQNDRALWQKFQSKNSMAEMADEISRQSK